MNKRDVDHFKQQALLALNLAKNDFNQKYAASSLGIVWGFLPSIMTILIYWMVFTFAFRSGNTKEPFLLWLMSGMIPWLFFSDAIVGATNCFAEYSYLVKKVVFNIHLLPIIKIISAAFTHVFFLTIMFFVLLGYGYIPSTSYLMLIYYLVCLILLSFALGQIFATLNVLFRDVSNLIMIILQFSIWLLPILWQPEVLPDTAVIILRFNPMFYIIEGYRKSFLPATNSISSVWYTVYFWGILILLILAGNYLFKKLNNQFADLL